MNIKTVIMGCFKGTAYSAVSNFLPVTIFTGPTGIGKTRILQAIQCAITGKVSDPNTENNIETIELLSKRADIDEMVAGVEFDDCEIDSIHRSFAVKTKDGKDSISERVVFMPEMNLGLKEANRKIVETVGSFSPMLNIKEFVRMTEGQRMKMLLSFVHFAMTQDELTKEMMGDDEIEPFSISSVPGLDKNIQYAAENHDLTPLIDFLKRKESETGKLARESAQATRGNIQSGSAVESASQSYRPVEDIKADIETARLQRDNLIKEIENSNATKKMVNEREAERENLRKRIDEASAVHRTNLGGGNTEAYLQSLRADLEGWKSRIIPLPDPATMVELKLKLANLKKIREEQCVTDYNDAKVAFSYMLTIKEKLKEGKCPLCGQDAHVVLEGIAGELELREKDVENMRDVLNLADSGIMEAEDHVTKHEETLRSVVAQNANIDTLIQRTEKGIMMTENNVAMIDTMQSRLDWLNNNPITGSSVKIEEARIQLSGIDTGITKLTEELRAKQNYDQRLILAKESAAKAKENEGLLTYIRTLLRRAESVRLKTVQLGLKNVALDVNDLLHTGVSTDVNFEFSYIDSRGNECFRFGWKHYIGGQFIDFDSLSTGQQLITMCALLPPLIARSDAKLHLLLIDDIEVISEEYRGALVVMLEKATRQYLHNVFATSNVDFPDSVLTKIWRLELNPPEVVNK